MGQSFRIAPWSVLHYGKPILSSSSLVCPKTVVQVLSVSHDPLTITALSYNLGVRANDWFVVTSFSRTGKLQKRREHSIIQNQDMIRPPWFLHSVLETPLSIHSHPFKKLWQTQCNEKTNPPLLICQITILAEYSFATVNAIMAFTT